MLKWFRKRVKKDIKLTRQMRYFHLEQDYFWLFMCNCTDPVMGPIFKAKHRKYEDLVWEEYDKIYKKLEIKKLKNNE